MTNAEIPVVLVHGWGGSYAATWQGTALESRLRAAGRTILRLDLPGHGSGPASGKPSEYAGITDQLLQAFAHQPVVDAIGFSLGGKLLLDLAVRFPARFRRLVVAGVGSNLFRSENGALIAGALLAEDSTPLPPALAFLADIRSSGNDLQALAAVIQRPAQLVERHALARITAPVLLLAGRNDTICGDPEELRALIPHATLRWLADTDHFQTTTTAEFTEMAASFVNGPSTSVPLVSRANEIALHQIRPDLRGTVIEGSNLTLVRWVVAPGTPATPLHSHAEHEQFTIMIAGCIDTRVGENTLILNAGDVCRIDAGTIHGHTRVIGDAEAVLIDVFEPRRLGYIAVAKPPLEEPV